MIQAYCSNCKNYIDYYIETTVTGQIVIRPNQLTLAVAVEIVCNQCNCSIKATRLYPTMNIPLEAEVTPK
jgi:hypothetical protein